MRGARSANRTWCPRAPPHEHAQRLLVRAREDLVGIRVELANQLRAQLQAFWPGALIFAAIDSPTSLAFIKRHPSPVDTRGLGAGRMAAFLTRNSHGGRTDPAELVERLNVAPKGTAGKAEQEARRAVVLGLVSSLEPIVSEIAALDAQIRERLAAHPDAAIFAPLFRDPKLRVATFRRACDKRLRVALATLADSTRHWHPWAKEVHRRARARGQDHPHAIRTLGRAWIRVLWRCWQDGVPYDAALHGNSHRLQSVRG